MLKAVLCEVQPLFSDLQQLPFMMEFCEKKVEILGLLLWNPTVWNGS
jgi:hypothetical protein